MHIFRETWERATFDLSFVYERNLKCLARNRIDLNPCFVFFVRIEKKVLYEESLNESLLCECAFQYQLEEFNNSKRID